MVHCDVPFEVMDDCCGTYIANAFWDQTHLGPKLSMRLLQWNLNLKCSTRVFADHPGCEGRAGQRNGTLRWPMVHCDVPFSCPRPCAAVPRPPPAAPQPPRSSPRSLRASWRAGNRRRARWWGWCTWAPAYQGSLRDQRPCPRTWGYITMYHHIQATHPHVYAMHYCNAPLGTHLSCHNARSVSRTA